MRIKMLKNLHNEGFDLTRGKVYTGVYKDSDRFYLFDDKMRRIGLDAADEGAVFEIVKVKHWKKQYSDILEKMGFFTSNGITYYKEYETEREEEDCVFSIILVPYNGKEKLDNICVVNFFSNEEEGTYNDICLTSKSTCEMYKDMSLLIMQDIIDTDFTIREKCFIEKED